MFSHETKDVTRGFANSETGAVTVDWVVLTAGLVGLGLATMGVVSTGVEDLSGDVETTLQNSNGPSIIQSAFAFPGWFDLDGETLDGVTLYNGGATLEASDVLGSVSGNNAYVISTNPNDQPGGGHAGGFAIDIDEADFEVGATYRASYWARAETGTVPVNMFNTGGGGWKNIYTQNVVGEEWTYVESEFTAEEYRNRIFMSVDTPGVTFGIDDVKIEKLN